MFSEEEDLRLSPPGPAGEQTRRPDPAAIHHEQVACAEEMGQVAEDLVPDGTGGPLENQESRLVARVEGLLRDGVRGKLEVEVADVHDPKKRPRLVRPRVASRPFQRSPTLAIR